MAAKKKHSFDVIVDACAYFEISQAQMCERLKVGRSTLSHWRHNGVPDKHAKTIENWYKEEEEQEEQENGETLDDERSPGPFLLVAGRLKDEDDFRAFEKVLQTFFNGKVLIMDDVA